MGRVSSVVKGYYGIGALSVLLAKELLRGWMLFLSTGVFPDVTSFWKTQSLQNSHSQIGSLGWALFYSDTLWKDINLISTHSVCMLACLHVRVDAHVPQDMCVDVRGQPRVSFLTFPASSCLRKALLLLATEHTRLTGSRSSGDSPASNLATGAWACRRGLWCLAFMWV